MIEYHRDKKVIMVIDNTRWHKGKKIEEMFDKLKRKEAIRRCGLKSVGYQVGAI